MGTYQVSLKDERGKDKSTFALLDAGKAFFMIFLLGELEIGGVMSVNVTIISSSILLGYQAVMNELFRVIGESCSWVCSVVLFIQKVQCLTPIGTRWAYPTCPWGSGVYDLQWSTSSFSRSKHKQYISTACSRKVQYAQVKTRKCDFSYSELLRKLCSF